VGPDFALAATHAATVVFPSIQNWSKPVVKKEIAQMTSKRFSILVALSALVVCFFQAVPARAQGTYEWSLAAQATADECFQGNVNNGMTPGQISANNASFSSHYPPGLSTADVANCVASGALPKVNQAYVWGLTQVGQNIWFGTVSNTLCLVLDSYYGSVPNPSENSSWVCDYKDNPAEDAKPPRIFVYNSGTNVLTDLTSKVLAAGDGARLSKTIGLRSAGNLNGVVFFAGLTQSISTLSSPVAMYAFNAQTQAYLGSYLFDGSDASHPYYNDIRKWLVANGQLYTGVEKPDGAIVNGAILKWTGSLANPFSFVEVGHIVGEPAYLVAHSDGHIYTTTWGAGGNLFGMSLYMSPQVDPTTGLTAADADNWTAVWNLNQYEVEPSALQVGGAMESFGGYLYFGTMHVPGTGLVGFGKLYPNGTVNTTTFLDTYRAIAIFRTQGFDPQLQTQPSVELLYGSATLPQYDPNTDTWSTVPNNMGGVSPTFGAAGFGNLFNNYTWSMAVFNNQLYVGTMDWSFLATNGNEASQVPAIIKSYAPSFYGADLWMFSDTQSAATAVNISGMGNYTSYGIRNMLADDQNLWIGMANPMNLRTDPSNYPGGWKLIDFPTQNGAPIITWYNPPDIVYGTQLSVVQLNATANVEGTFYYTPPIATVLNAGAGQMLSTTFAPYGSGNQYGKAVAINVLKAGTSSTVTPSAQNVLLKSTLTLSAHVASSTTGIPTGTVTFMDGATALGSPAALDGNGNASMNTSTLAAGAHPITVVYSGDSNYVGSTSPASNATVQDFQFNIGSGDVTSANVLPGGVAVFNITVAPTYGGYFPNDVVLTLFGLPAGDTYTITPSTIPAGSGAISVVVTVHTASTTALNGNFASGLTFALLLPLAGLWRLRRRIRGAGLAVLLLMLGLALAGINGCNGKSAGYFVAQPQTSTLTMTATSGNLQHTITLNLTVQ
jgi:hypothetical protein